MKKRSLIGLIPAGGKATRISPLPLSKELYPVGFQGDANNNLSNLKHQNNLRPKVVSHYLLEKMLIYVHENRTFQAFINHSLIVVHQAAL